MIARLRPYLGRRELAAAVDPRAGDVAAFETAFAQKLGARHAAAFPYGRTAIALLFKALGLEGRKIVCPAYTCVVVAHAIVISGNEPVFVDSREDDFNMDLELAADAVGDAAALVATSLFGHPVDLDALDAIRADAPELRVLQDCAHSFGASWRGRPVVSAGDAAVFGLNVSKIITSIFGGMLTTDDDELHRSVVETRDRALTPPSRAKTARRALYLAAVAPAFTTPVYRVVDALARRGTLAHFTEYYDDAVIDMPPDYLEALTDFEARVGIAQLERYRSIVEHRRRVAAIYDEELAGVGRLHLPARNLGATYSHYAVRAERAAAVEAAAHDRGVQLGRVVEYVVPLMSAYRRYRFVDRGVARRFPGEVLNLPVHCGVGETDARRIAAVVAAAA